MVVPKPVLETPKPDNTKLLEARIRDLETIIELQKKLLSGVSTTVRADPATTVQCAHDWGFGNNGLECNLCGAGRMP